MSGDASASSYTARARAIGGRGGFVRTDSETLKLDMAVPGSPHAKAHSTNPEQLFACGLASSFCQALQDAAHQRRMGAQDTLVQADILLEQDKQGCVISALLHVTMPGVSHAVAAQLVEKAYLSCPYARAMHGNVPVAIRINNHTLLKAA